MKKIVWCKGCTTPSSRPRIEFDERGYCNACKRGQEKIQIDWQTKHDQFQSLIKDKLKESPNRQYDCIVPVSGGKDSHFQSWYAKNKLGLSVLTVAVDPLCISEVGKKNRDNLGKAVGVDMVVIKPNPVVYAKLTSICFKKYGNPYIPFLYLVFSACARIAIEKNIPLFLYGENGETEYGGSTEALYQKLDADGVHARILGHSHCPTPDKWADEFGIDEKDLTIYQEPKPEEFERSKTIRLFLSDYFPWNNNYALNASLNILKGFKTSNTRTPGSYTFGSGIDDIIDHLYLWLMWPKFGYYRSSKYAAKDIREGKLTYEGAIELVRLYDHEFPWNDFDAILSVLDLSEDEFWEIAKTYVSDKENLKIRAKELGQSEDEMVEVWEKISEGKWRHINTIHGEERILEIPMRNRHEN